MPARPKVLYIFAQPLRMNAMTTRIYGEIRLIQRLADVALLTPAIPADCSETERAELKGRFGDIHVPVDGIEGPTHIGTPRAIHTAACRLMQSEPFAAIHGELVTGARAALIVGKKFGCPVVTSLHGDAVAEAALWPPRWKVPVRQFIYRNIERRITREARGVVVVSQAHQEQLQRDAGTIRGGCAVLPCLFGREQFYLSPDLRQTYRQKLSAQDRCIVIYSGVCSRGYVPFDAMAEIMHKVCELRAHVHYLILTPEEQFANERLTAMGWPRDRYTVLGVPHAEVVGYLNAADIGLLVRNPSPVNAVASPTKFGEYVACGLSMVVSNGIGDLTKLVAEGRLGRSLDGSPADVDALLALVDDTTLLTEESRRERAEWALKSWSWDAGGDSFLALYSSILEERRAR